MPRIEILTLAVVVGLCALPVSAAAPGFEGGAWRHQTKLVSAEIPGVSQGLVKLFAGRGARSSCHQTAQLADHPEALLTADDRAVCKLRKMSMSGGVLVFDTFCTNKRFPPRETSRFFVAEAVGDEVKPGEDRTRTGRVPLRARPPRASDAGH